MQCSGMRVNVPCTLFQVGIGQFTNILASLTPQGKTCRCQHPEARLFGWIQEAVSRGCA